jgi:uncharacterized protein YbjQ (UPF0145 family)
MVYDSFISTTFEIKGYRIVEQLGIVRGITVRSRSIVGNIGGVVQSLFGGNITIYTELCETARAQAYREMMIHAEARGANGIIGVRYDANEVMNGITEVLCYGTAVKIEKE